MTISQKIILSSTLVALLAALAAYMGWRNTQPIQTELVQKLTHTTEEIRFLDEIKNNVSQVHIEILNTLRYVNQAEDTNLGQYLKKGRLLDTHLKTLAVQIKSFGDFNKTPGSENTTQQLLKLTESLRLKVKLLFTNSSSFPEKSLISKVDVNSRELLSNIDKIILDANNLRFALIKEEGEKVQAQISKLNFWIILIGGLTFLMAIIFGWVIANNLSSEIKKLREAATKLNKGDYSARVDLKSNDEFGKLGQTFDGMAASLQQSKTIEKQKLELEKLSKKLKTKNDSLDRFVYRVSHDLKAPVLNIRSLLKLIKIKMANIEQAEVTQSFYFIEKSTDKLQQTIHDLLEVSRIEQSLESPEEWVNIEQTLSQVKIENSERITNSEVRIFSNLETEEIFFSSTNFYSILSNLISNGIKYCSTQRKPEIYLETETQGDFLCLRIRDNGLGIDLEKHGAKLFGMFNRFHNHVEGSGVGLYIVKKLIEESGGRIEVKSKVGQGTIFELYFKQVQEEVMAK